MAKTCFLLLLMLFIILTPSDLVSVKAKLCEKPSKTWSGSCKDTDKCDKKCIEWEGADHGSCHERESKYMCFCYVQCSVKDKTPAPPSEQPPKGGNLPGGGKPTLPGSGQPSPPGGSQPPPSPGGGQPSPPGDDQSAPSPGGGQPSAPDGANPAPSPGGGQPSPPDGGQPSPPDGSQPTPPPPESGKPAPPPGCNKLVIEKLIAEALANYKTQIEKASHI